ncbi:MAG: hypothetical protein IJT36_01355 [Alphaproteobacteria bacterium]|nr:hypothetical protein [Alphaproteobacteria bacterium]
MKTTRTRPDNVPIIPFLKTLPTANVKLTNNRIPGKTARKKIRMIRIVESQRYVQKDDHATPPLVRQ